MKLTAAAAVLLIATSACASHRLERLVETPTPPCHQAGDRVTWIVPQRAADRSRLSDWCQSVGPAAMRTPKRIDFDDDISRRGLVVATWNIHGGAGEFSRFASYLRRWALATASAPPHIVVLVQEAVRKDDGVPATYPITVKAPHRIGPRNRSRTDIESTAEDAGMWLAYVPSMRNGGTQGSDAEDRGSAVLSTLPLTDVSAIELPWVAQRRTVVAATVNAHIGTETFRFRVVNAHLDNRPNRAVQAAALAGWLDPLTTAIPVIVGGDFNTWFGSRERTVKVIDAVVPRLRHCETRATFRFGRHLDHLFASPSLDNRTRCAVAPETFGSDHRPILWQVIPRATWHCGGDSGCHSRLRSAHDAFRPIILTAKSTNHVGAAPSRRGGIRGTWFKPARRRPST